MNNKPTHQELKNQIAELKMQNEILQLKSHIQNEEDCQEYTLSILNTMGDSLFIKDNQSRLLFVNDAFCEMFNLTREEIIGKTLEDNVPSEERESFLKIDKLVLLNGIENINEETLSIKGRGTLIISTRKSRHINSSGTKFIIGVIRDITESKKAEEDLKKSEAQFRQLNAMKDKLFSIIGHDLRSPFSNIIGLSELLSESVKESDVSTSEVYSEMINSTAKNTLVLLENLLKWAKSQTGQINYKPEKISLPTLIQEVIEQSNSIARAKNILLKQITSEEIQFLSDEKMIKTVLRNLVSNAIKFTKPGGKISIFTLLQQHLVEVTISDNGIGINNAMCEKLFSNSTNTSSLGTANEKGSGLGLILCKEFVEKLGGTIWVESKEGKGSDFKFTLPLNKS
tara:strand:- start:171644 stop:172837 length:1194 start_codon:yes stop_codon:yes gene_type:complete